MGLLRRLVLLPLAPVEGVTWLSGRLLEEAERQYYDEDSITTALAELEEAAASGAVPANEAEEVEEELLGRLLEARARHNQPGGAR